MIGASGAVAAVLGAYLLFHPRARVATLVPLFLLVRVIEVPALVYLVGWFVWQVAFALATAPGGESAGVAVWAHVGGFAAGVFLAPSLVRRRAAA
jgi:hypothetical protein